MEEQNWPSLSVNWALLQDRLARYVPFDSHGIRWSELDSSQAFQDWDDVTEIKEQVHHSRPYKWKRHVFFWFSHGFFLEICQCWTIIISKYWIWITSLGIPKKVNKPKIPIWGGGHVYNSFIGGLVTDGKNHQILYSSNQPGIPDSTRCPDIPLVVEGVALLPWASQRRWPWCS